MKKLLLATTMLSALASGAAAVTLSPANLGQTATINYSGTTPNGNQSADVTATQTIKLDAVDTTTNTYDFSYTFTNTSDIPTRLVGFGFDTSPELTTASAGALDLFNQVAFTQSISGGVNVDVCFSTNNCSGGGGGGLLQNASTTGTFTLDFADGLIATILIDEFTARFQSIIGSPFGTSGIAGGNPGGGFVTPVDVNPVPLPAAAWMFMSALAGFGWLARRRKQLAAA